MPARAKDIPGHFIKPVCELDEPDRLITLQRSDYSLAKINVNFGFAFLPFSVTPQDSAAPEYEMAQAAGRSVNRREKRPMSTPPVQAPCRPAAGIEINRQHLAAPVWALQNKLAVHAISFDNGSIAGLM